MIFYQGGLSSTWSFIRVIFYQDGFIRFVFHYDRLSSVWSLIRVVFHQVNGLSSWWCFIRCMVSHQNGLSSGTWSDQGGLLPGGL